MVQLKVRRHSPSLESHYLFVFGFCRNPPADHWALVSGLPTYVAQNGLVSVVHLGKGLDLGDKEF